LNNIFLFDIDGTLSEKGIIPDSAKRTLKVLRDSGNLVLLATGRCLGQMKNVLSEVSVDGAILNNGGLCIIKDEIVYDNPISIDTINDMLDNNLLLAMLTKNEYLRCQESKVYEDFSKIFTINLPRLVSREYFNTHPSYSLGVYADELMSEENLVSKYPDLRFVKICAIGYDVINKDVDKAVAIPSIRAKYPNSKIIAFGDNYNDLEMLQAADISICMPTAPNVVKDNSDFITKGVFEDGIEYAVNYLKLGE